MTGIGSKPEYELRHFGRIKIYPDGTRDFMCCSRPIFRETGWEAPDKVSKVKAPSSESNTRSNIQRAQRRAKAAIREISLANRFSYFVTLTLDQKCVNRYDMGEITRKLNNWLDNQVRRKGLAYVLVPERHKDGAIHFHGFFNNALAVVDSGHKDRQGHKIFNLPAWTLGFTTAIELYGEYHKAVSYVQKYIGKQGEKPGGRWYYSGGALQRPEVQYCNLGAEDAPEGAHTFYVSEADLWVIMWTTAPEHGAMEPDF